MITGIAKNKAFLSIAFAILAAIAPAVAEKTKSEKLLAALADLETLEKSLPTERKPTTSMDEAEKNERAAAFLEVGRLCHDIMEGFSEPLGKKADLYLRASLAYSESSVTRAYLGSSHLIQARDTESVMTKISEVDIGLKQVDAAVKARPEDILTRAIRVECTIGLPSMFKRLDTVTSDLAILLKAYADAPRSFDGVYSPARIFELKAQELDQRGKSSMAEKYRERAKELAKGGA